LAQTESRNESTSTRATGIAGTALSGLQSSPSSVPRVNGDHWQGSISHSDVWSEPGRVNDPEAPLSPTTNFGEGSAGYFSQPQSHASKAQSQSHLPDFNASATLFNPPFIRFSPSVANFGSNTLGEQPSTSPEIQPAYVETLGLSPSVVDYLLGLFFHRYQLMLKFVSQLDFMAQKAVGHGPAFRPSLLLSMLAAGLRYSTRKEVTEAYLRPDGENILARAAKKALEPELHVSSITTVQSFLILAEVETAMGNDMTGYLYSSMASKLIFELQLDLGSSATMPLNDDETDRRHWLVWAASVGDQYWAVSLRRPLAIKNRTLQDARLAARFARKANFIEPPGLPSSNFEHQVNESLLDLMELAREVTDSLYGSAVQLRAQDASNVVLKLHAHLEQWYSQLPEKIRRGPGGGEDSYHFLFVLHLLFNVVKIILHQHMIRMAEPVDPPGNYSQPVLIRSAVTESSNICASSATRIAKLFEIFRRREDIRTLQCTGVQWATVATNAIIQHVNLIPVEEAVEAIAHLQSLGRTLKEMSKSFQPALTPYDESCKIVQVFWWRLNNDDQSTNEQTPFPPTQLTGLNLGFTQPWTSLSAPDHLDTFKTLDNSQHANKSFQSLQGMSHMGAIPITPRNQSSTTLRAEARSNMTPSTIATTQTAGSWTDSWEWESLLGQ
jgi:hypothetical protein